MVVVVMVVVVVVLVVSIVEVDELVLEFSFPELVQPETRTESVTRTASSPSFIQKDIRRDL